MTDRNVADRETLEALRARCSGCSALGLVDPIAGVLLSSSCEVEADAAVLDRAAAALPDWVGSLESLDGPSPLGTRTKGLTRLVVTHPERVLVVLRGERLALAALVGPRDVNAVVRTCEHALLHGELSR